MLHYQPIVSTAERAAALDGGAAALERPRARPGPARTDFIPAAEETGLLEPSATGWSTRWRAQVRDWEALGLQPQHVVQRLAARAAPARLRAPSCASGCARQGVDPARLTMELTESATLREPERIGPLLRELHALGLQLAIDDFGSG